MEVVQEKHYIAFVMQGQVINLVLVKSTVDGQQHSILMDTWPYIHGLWRGFADWWHFWCGFKIFRIETEKNATIKIGKSLKQICIL